MDTVESQRQAQVFLIRLEKASGRFCGFSATLTGMSYNSIFRIA